VYLPRIEAPAAAIPKTDALAGAMPRGSETILLVEDNLPVRALTRHTLEDLGYTVLEAGGGMEALAAIQQNQLPVDLLLTDVVMPEMNGRLLAQVLVTARPNVKVLYMSGYTDTAILHSAMLRHGAAFLAKPFTPKSLALKVREVLDGRVGGVACHEHPGSHI
jgi:CheY-like chemotaxis protein